jgi:hypothetical protein
VFSVMPPGRYLHTFRPDEEIITFLNKLSYNTSCVEWAASMHQSWIYFSLAWTFFYHTVNFATSQICKH